MFLREKGCCEQNVHVDYIISVSGSKERKKKKKKKRKEKTAFFACDEEEELGRRRGRRRRRQRRQREQWGTGGRAAVWWLFVCERRIGRRHRRFRTEKNDKVVFRSCKREQKSRVRGMSRDKRSVYFSRVVFRPDGDRVTRR